MAERRSIQRLTVVQIQTVAHYLAREMFDYAEPIPDFVTRFPNKLESCLNTPFQKWGGRSLYVGVVGKGAALFYFMIKNHPFQNGNKRIAVMTLFYFLSRNGKWLSVTNDELYVFAREVAKSDPKDREKVVKDIRTFIRTNLIPLSHTT